MERVMITLPEQLLESLDDTAERLHENRSQFIRVSVAERLADLQRREFDSLLAEGYVEMAEESAELALELAPLTAAAAADLAWDG